jgi:hypothetical protein
MCISIKFLLLLGATVSFLGASQANAAECGAPRICQNCVSALKPKTPGNYGVGTVTYSWHNACPFTVHVTLSSGVPYGIKPCDDLSDTCTTGDDCELQIRSISCDAGAQQTQDYKSTEPKSTSNRKEPKQGQADSAFCSDLPTKEEIANCHKGCFGSVNVCKAWMHFYNKYVEGWVGPDGKWRIKPLEKQSTQREKPQSRSSSYSHTESQPSHYYDRGQIWSNATTGSYRCECPAGEFIDNGGPCQ